MVSTFADVKVDSKRFSASGSSRLAGPDKVNRESCATKHWREHPYNRLLRGERFALVVRGGNRVYLSSFSSLIKHHLHFPSAFGWESNMTASTQSHEAFSDSKWYISLTLLADIILIDPRTVYKDSFEPQPSSRRLRGWERAPVPAHTPRLQGQTIWKRVGSRSQAQDDKENYADAQIELEKSGAGARKRQRVMGAKEVIGDALWAEKRQRALPSVEEAQVHEEVETDAPIQEGDKLQYVPRKRTNARRVISPQKALQPEPENSQVQTTKVSLKSEDDVTDKPPRRRKSMRKSIRKSLVVEPLPITEEDLQEQSTPVRCEGDEEGTIPTPPTMHLQGTKPDADSYTSEIQAATTPFQFSVPLSHDVPHQEFNELGSQVEEREEVLHEVPVHGVEAVGGYDQLQCQQEVARSLADEDTTHAPAVEPAQDMDAGSSLLAALEASAPGIDAGAMGEKTLASSISLADMDNLGPKPDAAAKEAPSRRKSPRRSTRLSLRATRASSIRSVVVEAEASVPSESEVEASSASQSIDVRADVQDATSDLPFANTATTDVLGDVHDMGPGDVEQQTPLSPADGLLESHTHSDVDALRPATGDAPDLSGPSRDSGPLTERLKSPVQSEAVEANCHSISTEAETAPDALSHSDANANLLPSIEVSPESSDDDAASISAEALGHTQDGLQAIALSNLLSVQPSTDLEPDEQSDTDSLEDHEDLEAIPITLDEDAFTLNGKAELLNSTEAFTPDPVTTELTEAISLNAPSNTYDHEDDTDMLRNFLTKVKANKAAKAASKRKRSLPHSPLQLPLGEMANNMSPSPGKTRDEFDVSLPVNSPTKKRKRGQIAAEETTEPQSVRRSTRTRLPVVKAPLWSAQLHPSTLLGPRPRYHRDAQAQ